MSETYGILSLLPPVTALIWALWRKEVYPALLLGVWMGWLVIEGGNPLVATASAIRSIVSVFLDAGNTRILIYSLMVGSVLTLISATGGVHGFIKWVSDRKWVTNRKDAQLVAFFIGIFITVESSITSLVAGMVGRPLTDRYKISREKLAYICDSTSAPICMLVPFNGWGAMVIGLLAVQGVEAPVAVLLSSLKYNFYPMVAIGIVLFTILSGREYGPMRNAEDRAMLEGKLLADGARPMVSDDVIGCAPLPGSIHEAKNLILPIVTMISTIIVGIYVTGSAGAGPNAGAWEIVQASSGSTSVLWAVIASMLVLWLLSVARKRLDTKTYIDLAFQGMGGMIPVVTLLLLAFALGATVKELGTGAYVAQIIGAVAGPKTAVTGLFVLACIMAFATGTSWGTFALMVPIAVPLAATMAGPLPLYLASVLGGGIFGDHCSPISDTSIISSMAAASDHIDHVRTQLPYALFGAAIAIGLYIIIA